MIRLYPNPDEKIRPSTSLMPHPTLGLVSPVEGLTVIFVRKFTVVDLAGLDRRRGFLGMSHARPTTLFSASPF
ncbi:MAG: hypothetical protein ACI9OD_000803 [Limisphaerales bacterium]|jgi:hypothetical protein